MFLVEVSLRFQVKDGKNKYSGVTENMDMKKWLNNRYTFYEEIFEFKGTYCLEFCLKEDLKEFIDLCFNLNIPYTFYPEYKVAICVEHLKLLIKKEEIDEKRSISTDSLKVEFSILP